MRKEGFYGGWELVDEALIGVVICEKIVVTKRDNDGRWKFRVGNMDSQIHSLLWLSPTVSY